MTGLLDRAHAAAQVLVDDLDVPVASDADAHHLRRVLRLRDGERVVASDGRGSWRLCVVERGELACEGPVVTEPAVVAPVRVWLPAVKGDRAEWAVAKLTELGVDEIGLLACDRAVVRLDDELVERVLARWRRVAREASCQSRRVRLPVVDGPSRLVEATSRGAQRCDLDGEAVPDAATSLAIGPEGGWSDEERASSPAVSLGGTVLRTETAAVAAAVVLTTLRRPPRHAAAVEAQ